jgi:hypothetical protein
MNEKTRYFLLIAFYPVFLRNSVKNLFSLKKEASVQQINQQLRIKSLTKNLPSLCYFNRDKFDRRNKDEARLHKFIEKELGKAKFESPKHGLA